MKKSLLFPEGSVICTLTSDLNSKAPTEFRIFKSGQNETTKGAFLFDAQAAKQVLATYVQMNRRCTVDYEHGSLQQNPIDPSKSGKAAGSFALELRDSGELWAVDCRWTPDAIREISEGIFIFTSPAFSRGKDNRPIWLINVSLTNNPATWSAAELILAASALFEAESCIAAAALSDLRASLSAYLTAIPVAVSLSSLANVDATTLSVLVSQADCRSIASDPRNVAHPCLTAPLSWSFSPSPSSDPSSPTASLTATTGWQGAIEDESATWIAFVALNGAAILWTQRTDDGLPTGEPFSFFRTDLIKDHSALAPSPIEVPNSAGIPKITKPGMPSTTPLALAATLEPTGSASVTATASSTPAPLEGSPMPTGGVTTLDALVPPVMVDGACKFAVGQRVEVSGKPHMPGQTMGTVAIAQVTDVYGIRFDAMPDMLHKWYVGAELSDATGKPLQPVSGVQSMSSKNTSPVAVDFTALSYDGPVASACSPMGCNDYDYKRANAREVADCFVNDPTLAEVSDTPPDHPAATSPLTGRYLDPLTAGVGRWLGYIEPLSKTWIAFVAMDGKCYLWEQRQGLGDNRSLGSNEGAGIGVPTIFMRTWETLSATSSRIASEDKDAAKLYSTRVALNGAWAFYESAKVANATYLSDASNAVTTLSTQASILAATLLAKGFSEAAVTQLGAIPFRGYPIDDTSPWDPDGATHRLRMWSSKDGTGDTGTIDFDKYSRGFAYCFMGQEQVLTGYVLPHHDVQHGELVTVKKAVQIAAAMIQGTRVALDVTSIPPGDVTAIREHIASHYHQWGAKTPWESQAKEAVAMHAKLTDTLSKNKSLSAAKLKAKMLKAEPSFTDEECSGLFGEDESKHTALAVNKMMKALAVLDATMTEDVKANVVGENASIVALGAALGMGLAATELDVVKGFSAVIGSLQVLNAMTGKSTIQESIAQIDKWREGDTAGKVAISELSAAKKGAEKEGALAMIARFESEGRLTPVMKNKAIAHFDTGGMLALNVYLEEREVIAGLGKPEITPHSAAAVAALNAVGALPGATTPQMAVDAAKAAVVAPAVVALAATGEVTDAEVLQISKLSTMSGLGKAFGKNPERGGADYMAFVKEQLADPTTLSAFRAEFSRPTA